MPNNIAPAVSPNPYAAFATPVDAPASDPYAKYGTPVHPSNPYVAFATPVAAPDPYAAYGTPIATASGTNPYDAFSTPVVAQPAANPYDAFSTPVRPQAQPQQSHANDFTPLPQGTDGAVPLDQAIATAHMRAAAHIQDLEQGRTFQKISDNPDGSAEYGYVSNPAGGRAVSPEEKQAILRAAIADAAGVGAGPQDTTDANGMKATAVRLQLQQVKSQNPIQNFAAAADTALANTGLGIAGQFNPQAANNLQDNLNYVSDPDAKASLAGSVAGGSGSFAAAQLADPSGNLAAAVMAAQAAGEARMEVARLRANGLNITPAQESMYVADKALLAGASGKISSGGIVGNPLAGGVNEFANNGLINAGLGAGKAFATGAADMGVNQSLGNVAAIGTGVDKNRDVSAGEGEAMLSGGLGAAAGHAVHAMAHPGQPLPEPQQQQKAAPAPEAKVPEAPAIPPEQQAKEAEFQAEQQKAADTTAKPSEAQTAASEHPPELADAKEVGDWYGKTFNDPANAQTIEALTSMHPGKYKLVDVPVDQIDPNAMMAGDTNRAKVEAIKNMTPEERAKMPPVIAVGEGDKLSIADGTHRLTAAQESGDKTIKAYVPEEFANDPSQLKRFVSGDTAEAEPSVKKALTDSGAKIEYTDAAGKEHKGTYLSVSDNGEHWVRDANGKLDRVPASDITTQLPKIPAEARSKNGEGWSHSKLKAWAKENGYTTTGKAGNLNALRKAIIRERNESLIDLPRPPKSMNSATFKKMSFWAEKNGYDLTGVEGKRDLIKAIKFQRKSALAEAKGKPLSDRSVEGHAQTIEAIKNARKEVAPAAPKEASTSREVGKVGQLLDIAAPLKSRIEDLSKPVYGRVMKMEMDKLQAVRDLTHPLEEPGRRIMDAMGKPGTDKFQRINDAMLNGKPEEAKALLPKELAPDVDAWFKSSPEVMKHLKDAGAQVGEIPNHIGREIADVKGLKETIGNPDKGPIAEAWDLARETMGKKNLTDEEKVQIANSTMQGFGPRKPGQSGPGFAKERSLEITPETSNFYKPFYESHTNYIRRAVDFAEKTRFLGQGAGENKGALIGKDKQSALLRDSIGHVIKPEVESGRLTPDNARKLNDLVHTLLTANSMHVAPGWKTLKDITHLAYLSQISQSITHLTTLGWNAKEFGVGNTLKGLKDAIHITPEDQRIVMKTLGIERGGQEFRDPGKIGKAVDTFTRKTGFQALDIVNKEARTNAARHWAMDAANNPDGANFKAMESRFKDMMTPADWQQTLTDLRAGKISRNTNFISFVKLTDLQPITPANMPEGYLKSGGMGRMMLTLHSFQLNQIDNFRRVVMRDFADGKHYKGLVGLGQLTAFLTAANFTKDMIRDLIKGKEVSPDQLPSRVSDAMLGIVGMSNFLAKTAADKPTDAIKDFLSPPIPWVDSIAHDAGLPFKKKGFDGSALLGTIPLIGDALSFRTPWGRGWYMNKEEEQKEFTDKLSKLRAAADEAEKDNDPTAEQLTALYNHVKAMPPPSYTGKAKPTMTIGTAHKDNLRAAKREKEAVQK